MLYHKFALFDVDLKKEFGLIRISDSFVQKMIPDLLKYKFTWDGYSHPKYGLSRDFTIIQPSEVAQLKKCLMLQSKSEHEYAKLIDLINKALAKQLGIIHQNGAPGHLTHGFVLCDRLPQTIDFQQYNDSCVKIQDQFISENYKVFKKVVLYWNDLNKTGLGFNYYGTTIITPQMAQNLLNTMTRFLENDTSEMAEYFVGEEYDILRDLLTKSIRNNQFLIHFGV